MKRPYRGMAARTTLITMILDNLARRPIEEKSLEDIHEAREQVYPTRPPFSWITGAVAKGVDITSGVVAARDGYEVPVRWYRPTGGGRALPLVVFFHGGGWVQGSTRMYDPLCSRLAAAVPAVVVSVDYRMAPEHRAPQAAQDAIDVTRSLIERPQAGYDPGRVALAGDSAGGNLSAVVAQQLRDLTGPTGARAIRHQALLYPATDLTMASPSIEEHAAAPILTKAAVLAFRAHYLGPDDGPARQRDPLVSPLFGEVEGVAPALVQTADLDPIRDDGLRYAAALQAAGVEVRASNYVRVPHGYASMPGACPPGAQAESELTSELRRHLEQA